MKNKINSVEDSQLLYHPWVNDRTNKDFIIIDQVPDSIRRESYKLNKGLPCADWFPENVIFEMHKEGGNILTDSVANHALLRIISPKFKELLEPYANEWIEFLPVGIREHDKQSIVATYYIANVLRSLPCMDETLSDFVPSALDKTQVHHIKHLVLDTDQIPEDAKIFRLGQELDLILVRSDLARDIKNAGMTGIGFMALENYGKQYRPVNRLEMIKRVMEAKGLNPEPGSE